MFPKIIVVLGDSNVQVMRKRITKAYKSSDTSTFFVLSGGFDKKLNTTQAEWMWKNYFEQSGISHNKCLLEKTSQNTIEKLVFSKQLIDTTLLHFYEYPMIAICTSSYHAKRCFTLTAMIFVNYNIHIMHTGEIVTEKQYISENIKQQKFFDSYLDINMKNNFHALCENNNSSFLRSQNDLNVLYLASLEIL